MGVNTFYIDKSLDAPQRRTVIFQGPENFTYEIFMYFEPNRIVETLEYFFAGTKLTRWSS